MANKTLIITAISVLIFFNIVEISSAKLFSWKDAKGVKHFSNTGAPSGMNVKQYREKISNSLEGSEKNNFFQVLKVYDGDTILVKRGEISFPVRLVAIDAPETAHGKQKQSQPYSKKSKKHLNNLTVNRKVSLVSYGLGGFNRILAEVFVGSINVNLEMIKEGLAEVYQGKKPPNLKSDIYYTMQKKAKKSRKGMWAQGRNYMSPKAWRKKHPPR